MTDMALALSSGVIGALVATIVTLGVEGSREKRRQKLSVFTALTSNRNDITGDAFSSAMNGVLAAFAEVPDVLRAHQELYSALSEAAPVDDANRLLIALWRNMAKSAKVDTGAITDSQFLQVMNPRS